VHRGSVHDGPADGSGHRCSHDEDRYYVPDGVCDRGPFPSTSPMHVVLP
jgi:hypothetical protein